MEFLYQQALKKKKEQEEEAQMFLYFEGENLFSVLPTDEAKKIELFLQEEQQKNKKELLEKISALIVELSVCLERGDVKEKDRLLHETDVSLLEKTLHVASKKGLDHIVKLLVESKLIPTHVNSMALLNAICSDMNNSNRDVIYLLNAEGNAADDALFFCAYYKNDTMSSAYEKFFHELRFSAEGIRKAYVCAHKQENQKVIACIEKYYPVCMPGKKRMV